MTKRDFVELYQEYMGRAPEYADYQAFYGTMAGRDLVNVTEEEATSYIKNTLEYKRGNQVEGFGNIFDPNIVNPDTMPEAYKPYYEAAKRSGIAWVDKEMLDRYVRYASHGMTPEMLEAELKGELSSRTAANGVILTEFTQEAVSTMGGQVSMSGTNEGSAIAVPTGTKITGKYWQLAETRDGKDYYVAEGSPSAGFGELAFGGFGERWIDSNVGRAAAFMPGTTGDEIASLGGSAGFREYQETREDLARPIAFAARAAGGTLDYLFDGYVGDIGEHLKDTKAEQVSQRSQMIEGVAQGVTASVADYAVFGGLPVFTSANRLSANAAADLRGNEEQVDWRDTGRDLAIQWGTAGVQRGLSPLVPSSVRPVLSIGVNTVAGRAAGREWGESALIATAGQGVNLAGSGNPVIDGLVFGSASAYADPALREALRNPETRGLALASVGTSILSTGATAPRRPPVPAPSK